MSIPPFRHVPRRLVGVGVLVLGLTACGGPVTPDAGDPPAVEVEDATPTPSPTTTSPAASPAPSQQDDWDTVDIGARRSGAAPSTAPSSSPTTDAPSTSAPTATPTATPTADPTTDPAEEAPTVLGPGDRGAAVTRVQERLVDLGYWLGSADGVYGALTEQAVLAFQGWEGITRDGRVGPETRRALAEAGRPVPDHEGDLLEIHRSQGVLLVVRDGATRWAIHTSTGSGEHYIQPDGDRALADTPAGTWTIDWQVDGWRESFLGRLWRPKYFHDHGLAIHGYADVPAWPASHGCARVSMEAMNFIWRQGLAPVGTTVVVS